ncbi:hypothetical protein [Histidinibacterium aquaticum]|uniref:Uncharacterized protein n=1 Tax=Histidinibacterium aquaticum TaxID=2613962 RepID=A0A5J5GBQ8_9RHOB|nr:hypothetical protein [Histidinibacterium aquaticum]KAA9005575.1 hypothetical protein F3S47_16865 [Histidinibacterium aquaticum]
MNDVSRSGLELDKWDPDLLFEEEAAWSILDWRPDGPPFLLEVISDRDRGRKRYLDCILSEAWLPRIVGRQDETPRRWWSLRRGARRKQPLALIVDLDLGIGGHTDEIEGPMQLRSQYGQLYRAAFPRFDYAFAKLYRKIYSASDLRTKYPRVFSPEHNEMAGDLADTVRDTMMNGFEISGAAIPTIGPIYKLVSSIRFSMRRWIAARRAEEDLEWIRRLSIEELRRSLPDLLVRDLRAHRKTLEATKRPQHWLLMIDGDDADQLPPWLGKTVGALDFVSVVMGTECALPWGTYIGDQERANYWVEVRSLSEDDFAPLFDAVGLTDFWLRTHIGHLGAGYPERVKALLDETQAFLTERGLSMDDLGPEGGKTRRELNRRLRRCSQEHVARVLEDFTLRERRVIGLAASIPFLDERTFVDAMDLFAFGTDLQDWATFCRTVEAEDLPREEAPAGCVLVPDPVAGLARKEAGDCDPHRVERMMRWLADRPESAEPEARFLDMVRASHARLRLDAAAHADWLQEKVAALLATGEAQLADRLLEQVWRSSPGFPSCPQATIRLCKALIYKVVTTQLPVPWPVVEHYTKEAILGETSADRGCDRPRAEAAVGLLEAIAFEGVVSKTYEDMDFTQRDDAREVFECEFRRFLRSTGATEDLSAAKTAEHFLARLGTGDQTASDWADLKLRFELTELVRIVEESPDAGRRRGELGQRYKAVRKLCEAIGRPPATDPAMLRAVAQIRLLTGRVASAFDTMTRRAELAPDTRTRILRLIDTARLASRSSVENARDRMYAATKDAVALSGPVQGEDPALAIAARVASCQAIRTIGELVSAYNNLSRLYREVVRAPREVRRCRFELVAMMETKIGVLELLMEERELEDPYRDEPWDHYLHSAQDTLAKLRRDGELPAYVPPKPTPPPAPPAREHDEEEEGLMSLDDFNLVLSS